MSVLFFALDEGCDMPIVSDFIGIDQRERRVQMPLTKAMGLRKLFNNLAIVMNRLPVGGVPGISRII